MVDMEGVSGICLRSQVNISRAVRDGPQAHMTRDVNACVDGCFKGGADSVLVMDCLRHNIQSHMGVPRPQGRISDGRAAERAHAVSRRVRRGDPAGLPRDGRHKGGRA